MINHTFKMVCKSLNTLCAQTLNAGFQRVERFHGRILASVKRELPRRESERRNHSLARHNDILTALETRLSLLGMTFNKFVDTDLCCFIPGKVIDEVLRILREVNQCIAAGTQPARPHELLQELRDISSMAMEYFDEKICPNLGKEPGTSGQEQRSKTPMSISRSGPPNLSTFSMFGPALSLGLSSDHQKNCCKGRTQSVLGELRGKFAEQSAQLAIFKKEFANLKSANDRAHKKLLAQSRQLGEQSRKFEEFTKKYDVALNELSANLVPTATKNGHVDSNKCEDEEVLLAGIRKGQKRKVPLEKPNSASVVRKRKLKDEPAVEKERIMEIGTSSGKGKLKETVHMDIEMKSETVAKRSRKRDLNENETKTTTETRQINRMTLRSGHTPVS